ncbi:M48 family metallopeptidase [Bacteroidota bacterium]
MKSKIVNIDGIGKVHFVRSTRAKRINVTVKPFADVKVSVPGVFTFKQAEKAIRQRTDWIIKHQNKMIEREEQYTTFTDKTVFKTKHHKVETYQTDRNDISVRVSKGIIKVQYPKNNKLASKGLQKAIRKGIERALRKEARDYLPDRVKFLAEHYNIPYKKVFIKNLKTRWGSCSRENNINLNIHLMRLPYKLIDYIILHELAHTIERNHSKHYWSLLDSYVDDAKAFERQLRQYSIQIY